MIIYLERNSIKTVNVEGAVSRPGKYFISEGETLSSPIKRAGGYSKSAYSLVVF